MPFLVYILHSKKLDKFYVGTTDNLEKRILEHNSCHYQNSFTSKGIPWLIYLVIPCNSSSYAYQLEKYIKSRKSSTYIKKLKDDDRLLSKLISRLIS